MAEMTRSIISNWTTLGMKSVENPKYVKFADSPSVFRLRGDMYYWIDGGQWGVKFKRGPLLYDPHYFRQVSKLISVSTMAHLNGKVLVPCTESDWVKANRGYIPSGYVLENGAIWNGRSYGMDEDGSQIVNPRTYDDCEDADYGEVDADYGEVDEDDIEDNFMYLLIGW